MVSFKLNLSQAKGADNPPASPGVFEVEAVSAAMFESGGGNDCCRVYFNVVGSPEDDGASVGCTMNKSMMVPLDVDHFMVDKWAELLSCFGWSFAEAQALFCDDNAEFKFKEHLQGRKGFVHFTPKMGEGSYPEVKFYSPNQAKSVLANSGSSGDASTDDVKETLDEEIPF
tara:strand:+ start:131 stop:643 length:513 start_codon:yes stop_codon:yes gene_type:complete